MGATVGAEGTGALVGAIVGTVGATVGVHVEPIVLRLLSHTSCKHVPVEFRPPISRMRPSKPGFGRSAMKEKRERGDQRSAVACRSVHSRP